MKTSAHVPPVNCAEAASPGAGVYEQLAAAIGAMRFGSVEITVHDGRVVQIEKREKVRLEPWGNNQFRPTA